MKTQPPCWVPALVAVVTAAGITAVCPAQEGGPPSAPPPPFTPFMPSAPSGPAESIAPGDDAGGRGGERDGYAAKAVGEAIFQRDPQTGSLIVIADEETNRKIGQIIQNLDRPIPQVLIKVLFLEVTHGNDLDLGVQGMSQHNKEVTQNADGTESISYRDTLETAFGLAVERQGGFYNYVTEDLELTIRAMSETAKLEVLSRPSILTRNNEEAVITIGQEVPLIENSRILDDGQTINTLSYRDVGIILRVTPHISNRNLVQLVVEPEISTLTGETVPISDTASQPIIAKRAASTSVVVPDGMTIVIGGMMQDTETESVRKVPILGDIPLAGWLFRRTIRSKAKTELMIFLTPHVVDQTPRLADLSARESRKMDIAPQAFSPAELRKHLDDYEMFIGPAPNWLTRLGRWMLYVGGILW